MTPDPAEIFRVIPSSPMISVGFNDAINFCVWVLKADGLIVPPFTTHSEKSGRLQTLGLSALVWQSWFERVVRSQHPMIQWLAHSKPRTVWVDQQMKNCQNMANALARDYGWDISEFNRDFSVVAL